MSSVNSVSTYPSSSSCQNSISSSNSLAFSSSSSATSYTRCQGLDLLIKAVHYVDGSFFGLPFIQKRVLIRRRPRRAAAYAFSDFVVNELLNSGVVGGIESETEEVRTPIRKAKRQRRAMAMPLKYGDSLIQPWKSQRRAMEMPLKYRESVIQPWKRQSRGGGRSIQVCGIGSDQI